MEIFLLIIGVIVVFFFTRSKGFDDPKPMSSQHLLSAIAGRADWLEKRSAAPIESQKSPSIVELTRKRREYIATLCLEVLSRGAGDREPKYPGATVSLNIFAEVAQYAKELACTGVGNDNAAVRAVKEKLFLANGVNYLTRWEV
jgi:hypothetical protein